MLQPSPDMPDLTTGLPPTARLIAPATALASCIRAHMVRDTTGRPVLPATQRLNHFPATLLCSVTWFVEGSSRLIAPPELATPEGRWLPAVLVAGPHTRPTASFNPGPVHAFMVMFFPQAWHALTGMDVSTLTDRVVSLDEVLGAEWRELSARVMAAADDEARVALVEAFIEPRWRAARAAGAAPGSVFGDWVHSLAAHVAAAGWGRSARNVERRIKSWVGQPLRGLRRLDRAEQSFRAVRTVVQEQGEVSWADMATRGGYSDQAHLCRETRAVTGHTPTELARRVQEDESYWVYRIWS